MGEEIRKRKYRDIRRLRKRGEKGARTERQKSLEMSKTRTGAMKRSGEGRPEEKTEWGSVWGDEGSRMTEGVRRRPECG